MCRYSPQGPRSGERGYVIAYSYDLENRLAAATVNRLEGTNTVNVVAGYVYNPFGIRVRADTTTTINQGTPVAKKKALVIDAHNGTGYAQVLEEKDGSGALTMSYTIGDDVIAQSGPSVTHHFGYDGHGSTRLLTGSASTITDRYDYDAYGVTVRGPSSTLDPPSSSLLYTGEQFDVDLQQYYLRARYYDQSRGRFTQVDPYAGANFDPQSLHKYSYCHGDPINLVDPLGQYTLAEIVVVAALVVVVLTAAYRFIVKPLANWRAAKTHTIPDTDIALYKTQNSLLARYIVPAQPPMQGLATSPIYDEKELEQVLNWYKDAYKKLTIPLCRTAANNTHAELVRKFGHLQTISFHRADTLSSASSVEMLRNPWNLIILYPKQYLDKEKNTLDYPSGWRYHDKSTYGSPHAQTKYLIAFYPGSFPIRPIMYLGELLNENQPTATGINNPDDEFVPPPPSGP